MSDSVVRVLVAGLGNMGQSHALAYLRNPRFEIVGLVNRSKVELNGELSRLSEMPIYSSFKDALDELKPDLVSINTYSDSHSEYAILAMEAGAHVFVEKPLATNVADAKRVIACANATGRKLVIGYILRHHPSWTRFIEEAKTLGGPYVFRMNLNQQSKGQTWNTHKNLMKTTSPLVDCGVHYIDVMCQISSSRPLQVRAVGLRLSNEIAMDMYNYGHLQVNFEDGSIGWYECGWGPMMSQTAYFVKDVITPNGSVSIVMDEDLASDDIDSHTKTSQLRIHHAQCDENGQFVQDDTWIDMEDEPGHQELCEREQAFVLKAIEHDIDLQRHMDEALQSLHICLGADESVKTGQTINL